MQRLMIAIGCSVLLLASVVHAEEPAEEKLVKLHYSLAGFEPKSWGILKLKEPQVYAFRFDGKPVEATKKPDAEQLAKERLQMLEEVSDLLRNTIEPATWASATGKGTIAIGDDGLTILQIPRVHETIRQQLYALYCLQITQIKSRVATYRIPKEALARWMGDAKQTARRLTAEERAELLVKEKIEPIAKTNLVVPNCQAGHLHTPDDAHLKVLVLRAYIRTDLKGVNLVLPSEVASSPVKMEFDDTVLVSLSSPEADEAHRYVVMVTPNFEFLKYEDQPWEGKAVPPGK